MILCFHLIELSMVPWKKILINMNIVSDSFALFVLLKIIWAVAGTLLIEKYKEIYKKTKN